jgi:hypothetical protein
MGFFSVLPSFVLRSNVIPVENDEEKLCYVNKMCQTLKKAANLLQRMAGTSIEFGQFPKRDLQTLFLSFMLGHALTHCFVKKTCWNERGTEREKAKKNQSTRCQTNGRQGPVTRNCTDGTTVDLQQLSQVVCRFER